MVGHMPLFLNFTQHQYQHTKVLSIDIDVVWFNIVGQTGKNDCLA